jgi:hypothetical protein
MEESREQERGREGKKLLLLWSRGQTGIPSKEQKERGGRRSLLLLL